MAEHPAHWPPAETLAWTPRQRQVLDLIGHGRTNAEIAKDLGITLGGAKWHVSEVLSKLGVTSREEAARYWHDQHGVGARVRRAARGMAAIVPLKAVAGTAAVAAIAGGLVLGIGIAGTNGHTPSGMPGTATAAPGSGPVYTTEEAWKRAVYVAGLYLKQTDIPRTTQISGHPLGLGDLTLVDSGYTPATTDAGNPRGVPGNSGAGTWKFEWERDGVTIPGPNGAPIPGAAAPDGIVTLRVTFEDGTGKILTATGGKSLPPGAPQQPTPAPTPDPALLEPVTMAFPVATLGAGNAVRSLGIYQTRGGEWCWSETDWIGGTPMPTCPVSPSASANHIFGIAQSGTLVMNAKRLPVTLYGAVSADVGHVELVPASGDPVAARLVNLPANTDLPYRAFFTEMGKATGSQVTVKAFAADGTLLEQDAFPVRPSEFESTDGVVQPVTPISFSGTGDVKGGAFELPPPAFPVKIALSTTYDGDGPIHVDLVCDTGTQTIVDQAGQDGDANGSLIVDVPPEATHCSFDVRAEGWWSIRSK